MLSCCLANDASGFRAVKQHAPDAASFIANLPYSGSQSPPAPAHPRSPVGMIHLSD
jgi:hypothetical protein